jgi:hypothetical protein
MALRASVAPGDLGQAWLCSQCSGRARCAVAEQGEVWQVSFCLAGYGGQWSGRWAIVWTVENGCIWQV